MSEEKKRELARLQHHMRDKIETSKVIPDIAHIPERYRGKTFLNYDPTGIKKEIEKATVAIRNKRSVFITGPCGTGKTHMGLGLIYEWARNNFTYTLHKDGFAVKNYLNNDVPVYTPMIEVLAELRHAMHISKAEIDEETVLANYLDRPVVFLDDVGSEKITDWSRQILYLIVDRLYRTDQQLIITTNMTLQELAEATDDRIASRLMEMCTIIKLSGHDRRLAKK